MAPRSQWRSRMRSFKRKVSLLLLGILLAAVTVACSVAGASDRVELTLVSFAVTRAAYERIVPLFEAKWQQEHGQRVSISRSYGGSGSQTRSVIDGLQADVVALALALDTNKIVDAGLMQPGWEGRSPNRGIVHRSVAVLVTKESNPKQIQDWADLARDEISVVMANPKTSGGARWNLLALWGAVTKTGGTEAQAIEYMTRTFANAPALPRDAREATDVFVKQGQGDVLINYENEVLLAQQNGKSLSYIVPDVNISIDSPVAVVDAYVDKHGTRAVAEAFVQFLFTPEAQREFAKAGFRPVEPTVAAEFAAQYPPIATLFTVEDLGGWSQVQSKFFADGALFDKIQASIGKS